MSNLLTVTGSISAGPTTTSGPSTNSSDTGGSSCLMNKTVLVTGASGFIGRPLSEKLEESGCKVIRHSSKDGDIASCPLPGGVDHVYHLAARTFVPDSWSEPDPYYSTNVLG